jgi:hypothetical protein
VRDGPIWSNAKRTMAMEYARHKLIVSVDKWRSPAFRSLGLTNNILFEILLRANFLFELLPGPWSVPPPSLPLHSQAQRHSFKTHAATKKLRSTIARPWIQCATNSTTRLTSCNPRKGCHFFLILVFFVLIYVKDILMRSAPQKSTGGVAALNLCARLHPATGPRITPVRKILSPSLRTHLGVFRSASATKCVSPATIAAFQTGRFHSHTRNRVILAQQRYP